MANPPGVPNTLPKTVPSPPYKANGKGAIWVQIGSVKYYPWGKSGSSHDPDPSWSKWPKSAVTKMAVWEWEAKKIDNDKYSDISSSTAEAWLEHHKQSDGQQVAAQYALIVKPPPSVGPVPGGGTAVNTVNTIGDFLSILTSAAFWLRALEIVIGILLLAVGVAHISEIGRKTIGKTPIGKLV